MSDNFHKFLFLGVMLVLTVFANRSPSSGNVAGQGVGNLIPAVAENSVSAVAVGLPQQISASDSSSATNDAAVASPLTKKSDEATNIVKEILGDKSSVYFDEESSMEVSPGNGGKSRDSATGFFLGSEAVGTHSAFYRVGDEPLPETGSKIALVADLGSGKIFYGLNSSIRWPLASITKLMTAELIMRNGFLEQSTTITEAEFAVDGSTENLKVGESYSLADLRSAMLVESNNEAAIALADFYGYGRFTEAMNAEAQNRGFSNTYFSDPIGLSAANQSTANDLLRLAQYIFSQYPEIFNITRKTSVSLKELNSGSRIAVKNINTFAGRADFLGGKTGYTDDASGNLLSVFSYEKQPILIIVMGTEDRFGDTEKLLGWFERNYR